MASVRFENITFRYGDKYILKDFSLEVEESRILCLVGPSGCGKTTLVRCLLGLSKPEQGETGLKSQAFHLASLWGHHDMAQQPAGLGNGLRSRHANNNCSAGKVGMIIKKYCK